MKTLAMADSAVPYNFIKRLSRHLPSQCFTHSGHDSNHCDYKSYWESFGLVYYTNIERRDCGALLTPLISVSGERSVFRNNEPEMVVEPFLWSYNRRSYLSRGLFERTLASLVESGIWSYYKYFKDVRTLSLKFRRMNFQLHRNNTLNYYTYAVKIYQSGNLEKLKVDVDKKDRKTESTVEDFAVIWILYFMLISFSIGFTIFREIYSRYFLEA